MQALAMHAKKSLCMPKKRPFSSTGEPHSRRQAAGGRQASRGGGRREPRRGWRDARPRRHKTRDIHTGREVPPPRGKCPACTPHIYTPLHTLFFRKNSLPVPGRLSCMGKRGLLPEQQSSGWQPQGPTGLAPFTASAARSCIYHSLHSRFAAVLRRRAMERASGWAVYAHILRTP